nr:hypothetical protein [uncultured bacterium]
MGYIVTIERSEERPIEPEEFRSLAEADAELTVDDAAVDADVLNVWWREASQLEPVAFVLSAGRIDVTNPSNAALRKMQELAGQLEAKVVGEEGEDLTDVESPDFEVSAKGLWGCLGLLVLIAVIVWLLL